MKHVSAIVHVNIDIPRFFMYKASMTLKPIEYSVASFGLKKNITK